MNKREEMKYKLISEIDGEVFQDRVNEALEEGYAPLGTLLIKEGFSDIDVSYRPRYVQAFILKKEREQMKLSTLIDQLLELQNELADMAKGRADPEVSMCVDLGPQLQDRVGEITIVNGEVMILNERFDDEEK